MYTVVASDDKRITECKYHNGDKFVLEHIPESWDSELKKSIAKRTVAIKVDGYILDIDGEIKYGLKVVEPKDLEWYYWILSEKEIDDNFLEVDYEDISRFLIGD
jgi:hypothetical protein